MDVVVEIEGLRKEFRRIRKGRVVAIDNLDLRIPSGGVFGFLGRNGAGKTTTIRCLLGLSRVTSGTLRAFGQPLPSHLSAVAPRIGSVVETPSFVPTMSAFENLSLLAAMQGIGKKRVEKTLEVVGLSTRSRDLVKTYSLGMKQRLGIAMALVKDPELLILDEPANGLDPAGIREVRELIRSLGQDGRTVIVSSHLLSEVQQMCDTVAIIDRGGLIASGTVDELLARSSHDRLLVRVAEMDRAQSILDQSGISVEHAGDYLIAACAPDEASRVSQLLGEQNLWVQELTPERASLEELFIELTGGEERHEAGA